ncbi:MAG TPA: hypothetical protein PKA20_06735 [Burkholderiaceae bacterium]|nr:hypothetical protein [Burkholderiaceae bacterium]
MKGWSFEGSWSSRRAAVRAAVAFTAALVAGPAAAAGAATDSAIPADYGTQLWVNPGIHSFHFDRDKGLRENNYGLGLEAVVTPEHVLAAGRYRNSNDRMSSYAAYTWRPLQWGALRLGVMLAAFDGYPNMRDGGWFAAVLPAASLEYGRLGVNFTIVPTYQDKLNGAFAVQLKLRVW